MQGIQVVRLAAEAVCCWLSVGNALTQGLLVDQASATSDQLESQGTLIPGSQIAQSFTPSLSAVGFVQLQTAISAASSGETLIINLRQDAYNGPVVSSTTPVFLVNKITQINTFYFSGNIPITPNQLYYFEPVLLSGGSLFIGYKPSSIYAGGEPWINGGPSGPGDFWFREGIVVPEPGAVWLLLLGGGLFLFRWRAVRRS